MTTFSSIQLKIDTPHIFPIHNIPHSFFQNTDKECRYPNITRPYQRNAADQCSYARYSTEGWPGGTPLLELDGNHIEGAARSKVSRSSSPAAEESLGLSRLNSGARLASDLAFVVISTLLVWFNR